MRFEWGQVASSTLLAAEQKTTALEAEFAAQKVPSPLLQPPGQSLYQDVDVTAHDWYQAFPGLVNCLVAEQNAAALEGSLGGAVFLSLICRNL